MRHIIVSALLLCLTAGNANASCTWETKCGTGGCTHVPVCDAVTDFAPQHNSQNASKSGNAMLLNRNAHPPANAQQCYQQKVCTKFGNCNYVNICP